MNSTYGGSDALFATALDAPPSDPSGSSRASTRLMRLRISTRTAHIRMNGWYFLFV